MFAVPRVGMSDTAAYVAEMQLLSRHNLWVLDVAVRKFNPRTALAEWAALLASSAEGFFALLSQAIDLPASSDAGRNLVLTAMCLVLRDRQDLIPEFYEKTALRKLVEVLQSTGHLGAAERELDAIMAGGIDNLPAAAKMAHLQEVIEVLQSCPETIGRQCANVLLTSTELDTMDFNGPPLKLLGIVLSKTASESPDEHNSLVRTHLARRFSSHGVSSTADCARHATALIAAVPRLQLTVEADFEGRLRRLDARGKFRLMAEVDLDVVHPMMGQTIKAAVQRETERAGSASTADQLGAFNEIKQLVVVWMRAGQSGRANLVFAFAVAGRLSKLSFAVLSPRGGGSPSLTDLLGPVVLDFAEWYRQMSTDPVFRSVPEADEAHASIQLLESVAAAEIQALRQRSAAMSRVRQLFSSEFRELAVQLFVSPLCAGFDAALERDIQADVKQLRSFRDTFDHFNDFLSSRDVEQYLATSVKKELKEFSSVKRAWDSQQLRDLLDNQSLRLAERYRHLNIQDTIDKLEHLQKSKRLFSVLKTAALAAFMRPQKSLEVSVFVSRVAVATAAKRTGAKLEMRDLFEWVFESIFRIWTGMQEGFFDLTVTLDQLELCFGEHALTNAQSVASEEWLIDELNILAQPLPSAVPGVTVHDTERVVEALDSYLALQRDRNFLVDLRRLVKVVSASSMDRSTKFKNDEAVTTLWSLASSLEGEWSKTRLSETKALREQARAVIGGIHEEQRTFLSAMCTNTNVDVIKRIRADLRRGGEGGGKKWSFLSDDEIYTRLKHQVNDDGDHDAQEVDVVNALDEIRGLMKVLVFQPHSSLGGFLQAMEYIQKSVAVDPIRLERTMALMQNAGRMSQTVQRIATDHGMRTGQKDEQSLREISKTGVWMCREPASLKGEPEQLVSSTISLRYTRGAAAHQDGTQASEPEAKHLTFLQAQDLRDRLFLETDNESDSSAGVKDFHEMLENVRGYALSLLKLHMAGFVVVEASTVLEGYEREVASDVTPLDVVKLRKETDETLKWWAVGISSLRVRFPGLNYFTVSQVMQLQRDIATGKSTAIHSAVSFVSHTVDMAALSSWPALLSQQWNPQTDYTQDSAFCEAQARMFLDARGYPSSGGTALFESLRNFDVTTSRSRERNPLVWATLITNASEDELRRMLTIANKIASQDELRRMHTQPDAPAQSQGAGLLLQLQELCQRVYDSSAELHPMIFIGIRLVEGVGTLLKELDDSPSFRQLPAGTPTQQRAQPGVPNVVVCGTSAEVLPTLLSFYAQETGRLPAAPEVEFCSAETSWERVNLLLKRCFDRARARETGSAHDHLFCLAGADSLPRTQQLELVAELESQANQDSQRHIPFRLVLLCTRGDNMYSESFHKYVVECPPLEIATQRDCWRSSTPERWEVGQSTTHIKVYVSSKVGTGKTWRVCQDIVEAAPRVGQSTRVYVPVFGDTDADQMFEYLREGTGLDDGDWSPLGHRLGTASTPLAYHINVASSGDWYTDILLFRLLIMNDLETSSGRHFRLQSRHAVLIELASDSGKGTDVKPPLVERLTFASRLPTTEVVLGEGILDTTLPEVQRVVKYLQALQTGELVARQGQHTMFKASEQIAAGEITSPQECRQLLEANLPRVRKDSDRSVLDDSMILTLNFVRFLNNWLVQLEEEGEFLQHDFSMLAPDSLLAMSKPDLRQELVRSLVDTAREFSARFLSARSLLQSQLELFGLRRTMSADTSSLMGGWAKRPLILPCKPSSFKLVSMDPSQVPQEMREYWSTGFNHNMGWTFEDYRNMTQETGIALLCEIMNVKKEEMGNVDQSFVLTIDNIMKMLAVWFRVGSQIPVVIMGETGCGKTFSINYLAAFLDISFFKLDVHGGITDADVVQFMDDQVLASCVREPHKTVWCFLDEINTCDSLGLFKEMICDKSMKGRSLPDNLVLLAACNPYRYQPKTSKVSSGLQLAGAATEGDKLVYVVRQLPETLYDFIWDYGTLNKEEEKRYIESMLKKSFEARAVASDPAPATHGSGKWPDETFSEFFTRQAAGGDASAPTTAPASAPAPTASVVIKVTKTAAGLGMFVSSDCRVLRYQGSISAAQQAGVQLGSKITAVDGVVVTTTEEVAAQLRTITVGDVASLAVVEPLKPMEAPGRALGMTDDDEKSFVELFAVMVGTAHDFIRKAHGEEVSVVSLRDVARCIKLFKWFFETAQRIHEVETEDAEAEDEDEDGDGAGAAAVVSAKDDAVESMLLAVAHCYHFRLGEEGKHDRKLFRYLIEVLLRDSLLSADRPKWKTMGWFEVVLKRKMQWFIDAMKPLPAGVADNAALQENIFMMVVCILNKIAIMVVGKPGSSKTLATQLIRDAFSRAKKSDMYERVGFASLELFPYQCSQHSTAHDIEEKFEKAIELEQKGGGVASCVVLDEVGLAEDAKAMPLKVLHKLLEKPKCAFVGLSNWTLDPAKMNRAVYLLRPDTENPADLRQTALELVKGAQQEGTRTNTALIEQLPKITDAYIQMVNTERSTPMYNEREGGHFTGLRDFYSFVKLIDKRIRSSGGDLDSELLLHAIFRSFGGFREHDLLAVLAKPFWDNCQGLLSDFDGPENIVKYRTDRILGLLRSNVEDVAKDEQVGGDVGARHLMVLSQHVTSALSILQDEEILVRKGDKKKGSKAKVLCGSPFRDDQSSLGMFSRVMQVKACMETGRTVVLLHQDGIYESLYDMLNQNYTDGVAGGKFCRLAIGSRSRPCEVRPDFRCVVIVDSVQAWTKLPAPLLNRFEKMCVSVADLLEPEFREYEEELWRLCRDFANAATVRDFERNLDDMNTSEQCQYLRSVFVGFSEELIPSILLQTQRTGDGGSRGQIIQQTQRQLLQLATPEAVVKFAARKGLLGDTYAIDQTWAGVDPRQEYFKDQTHSSLLEVIEQLPTASAMVLTFSSIATSLEPHLEHAECKPMMMHLSTYNSEEQLRVDLEKFFDLDQNKDRDKLILQCEVKDDTSSAQIDRAKQICEELRGEHAMGSARRSVVFVVHLEKDGQPDGVRQSYLFHQDSWFYTVVDAVENAEVQKQPAVHDVLGTKYLEEVLQREDNLVVRQIIQQSFRKCLSRLMYPDKAIDVQACISRMQSLIEDDDRFLNEVLHRLSRAWGKPSDADDSDSQTRDPWFSMVGLIDIAKAGTYRGALFQAVEHQATASFTRLLAGVDRGGNLSVFRSDVAFVKQLWLDLFRDGRLSQLPPENTPPIYQIETGSRNHAFQANFPFVCNIYEFIERFRATGVAAQLAHDATGAKHDEWASMWRLLSARKEMKAFNQTMTDKSDDEREKLRTLYLQDVIELQRERFRDGIDDWEEYSELAQAFVERTIMDNRGSTRDACFAADSCISDIHMAIAKCEAIARPCLCILEKLRVASKEVQGRVGLCLEEDGDRGLIHFVVDTVVHQALAELQSNAESLACDQFAATIESVRPHFVDVWEWIRVQTGRASVREFSSIERIRGNVSRPIRLGDVVQPAMEGKLLVRSKDWISSDKWHPRYAVLLQNREDTCLHLFPDDTSFDEPSIAIAVTSAQLTISPDDTAEMPQVQLLKNAKEPVFASMEPELEPQTTESRAKAAREEPRWCRSDETDGCMLCGKDFGILNRKHHCRACGWAVCGDCSDHTLILDKWLDADKPHNIHATRSTDPLRVCTSCHVKVPKDAETARQLAMDGRSLSDQDELVLQVNGAELVLSSTSTVAEAKEFLRAKTGRACWEIHFDGQRLLNTESLAARSLADGQVGHLHKLRFETANMLDDTALCVDWHKLQVHMSKEELVTEMNADRSDRPSSFKVACTAGPKIIRIESPVQAEDANEDDSDERNPDILLNIQTPAVEGLPAVQDWLQALQSTAMVADDDKLVECCKEYRDWNKLLLVQEFIKRVTQPLKANPDAAKALWGQIKDPNRTFGGLDMLRAVVGVVSETDSSPSLSVEKTRQVVQEFCELYITHYAFQEAPCTSIVQFVAHACDLCQMTEWKDERNPWVALELKSTAARKQRASWISDRDAPTCFACHRAFDTYSEFRHHCRLCGQAFCTACSCNEILLDETRDQAERVCGRCYAVAGALQPAEGSIARSRSANDGLHRTRSAIEYQFVECYENQECEWGVSVNPSEQLYHTSVDRRPRYTHEDGSSTPANFSPERNGELEWQPRLDGSETDENGWQYAFSFRTASWGPVMKTNMPKTWVRRRKVYAPSAGRLPSAPAHDVEASYTTSGLDYFGVQFVKKGRRVLTQVKVAVEAAAVENKSSLEREDNLYKNSSTAAPRRATWPTVADDAEADDSFTAQLLGPLTDRARHALIREVLSLVDFSSPHCSVRQLIDRGALAAFHDHDQCIDNPITLQMVEAFEDMTELSPDNMQAWMHEASKGPHRVRTAQWARTVARCRAIVAAAAEDATECGTIEPLSFIVRSQILDRVLRPGLPGPHQKPRAIQVLFAKHVVARKGTQEAFNMLTDWQKRPDFPTLQCPDLQDELGKMQKRGSTGNDASFKPSFDPMVGLIDQGSADGMYQAIIQSIVFDDSLTATAEDARTKLVDTLTRRSRGVPLGPEVTMAGFHNLFMLETRGISAKVDSVVRGLQMSPEAARLLRFVATSGGDTASRHLPQVTPETTLPDILLLRPIVHMAAVCVSGIPTAFPFAELMTEPQSFAGKFLPAQPDDELTAMFVLMGDVAIYKCPAGHMYTVANCTRTDQSGICAEPGCGKAIGNKKGASSHTLAEGNTLFGYTNPARVNQGTKSHELQLRDADGNSIVGGQDLSKPNLIRGYGLSDPEADAEKLPSTAVRGLTPASTRVLRYLTHGLLLMSHGLNFGQTSARGVEQLLGDKAANGAGRMFLLQHVRNDFDVLLQLFSCNAEDLSMRLHLYVHRFRADMERAQIVAGGDGDSGPRDGFEQWFQTSVIDHVNPTVDAEISRVKSQSIALDQPDGIQTEVEEGGIPCALRDRNEMTPLLLRFRKRPSYQALVEEFSTRRTAVQDTFPLLKLFQKHQYHLRVHRHMSAVCHWLKLVKLHYSKKIDRADAENTTVQDALDKLRDKESRAQWEAAWTAFRDAWKEIRRHITRYACTEQKGGILPPMDERSPLAMSMPHDKPDRASLHPFILLTWFEQTHNVFLSDARELQGIQEAAQDRQQRREWHRFGERDFLEFSVDELEKRVADCAQQPNRGKDIKDIRAEEIYGRGKELSFDYAAIEEWVAETLVVGKQMLAPVTLCESFEFIGELVNADTDNTVGGIEQVPLENRLASEILAEQSTLQKAARLQQRVRECIGFLQSTKTGDGSETLSHYCQYTLQLGEGEINDLYAADGTAGFVMRLVQLCHLKALDELLEQQLHGDCMASVAPKYKQRIPADVRQGMEDYVGTTVNPAQVKKLLAAWKRFVRQHISDFREDFPEASGLKDYLEYSAVDDLGQQLLGDEPWFEKFPSDGLLLAHCSEAFTFFSQLHRGPAQASAPPALDVFMEDFEPEPEPEPELEPEPDVGFEDDDDDDNFEDAVAFALPAAWAPSVPAVDDDYAAAIALSLGGEPEPEAAPAPARAAWAPLVPAPAPVAIAPASAAAPATAPAPAGALARMTSKLEEKKATMAMLQAEGMPAEMLQPMQDEIDSLSAQMVTAGGIAEGEPPPPDDFVPAMFDDPLGVSPVLRADVQEEVRRSASGLQKSAAVCDAEAQAMAMGFTDADIARAQVLYTEQTGSYCASGIVLINLLMDVPADEDEDLE